MTDEDKIKTVSAVLTGEFYVGQRVRVVNPLLKQLGNYGTVAECYEVGWVGVTLDGERDLRVFLPRSITPTL